jgi:hypothetical protein
VEELQQLHQVQLEEEMVLHQYFHQLHQQEVVLED